MDAAALLDAAGGAGVIGARAVALGATVLAVGAVAFRLTVARRTGDGDDTARMLGLVAACALIVAAPWRLWLQARGFVDTGDAVFPMMANVLQTRWGTGWTLQLGGAGLALVGFMIGNRRANHALGAVGALLLVTAPAFMGHAIAVANARWLAVGADAAHTLAASAWTGALVVLTAWGARRAGAPEGNASFARMIHAFHPVALASAVTVAATGALGAWLRVARLATLLHTDYGAILGAKLALVAAIVVLGTLHSRRGERDALAGAPALQRSLRAEVALAVLTIVVTALLVGTSPEPGA